MRNLVPVISFVGRHNSGKTTVLTEVINHLSWLGYKVAVIKHVHHTLHIEPLKDSEKLFQAGADFVMASSPGLSIQYRRQDQEPGFLEILDQVPGDMDLIIVEGFKNEALDKIEVLRREIDPDPMCLPGTRAFISDFAIPRELPVFASSQIEDIAGFILEILGIHSAMKP